MTKKEMLINVIDPAECRIAIIVDGRLEELYIERASSASHVANIYKGRVTNVEPSIQAAFVDFGIGKNGFLHISDLNSSYFPGKESDWQGETVGNKRPRSQRPPIQHCLRRGSEVVVQVIKEGIGTKGPTLSTYLSIPGRYLVVMPGLNRLGVSRKIEDEAVRRKLRQTLSELNPPENLGFIIRTAGMAQPKRALQRDLAYLVRLWNVIEKRIKTQKGPCAIYQESDLIIRTIRDVFSTDIVRIVVDNEAATEKAREFLRIASPRAVDRVVTHSDPIPLFHAYGIESEIEKMYRRQVPMPSGGSLVIDQTEAMVTIDVNSGTFRRHNDADRTILQTNLEAAHEIPRQLRLRDLGGLIVCDFIDMRDGAHCRRVEREFREGFKNDKARTKVLRMNNFALIAMTRQRMRPDLKGAVHQACPMCGGSGQIKTAESMALEVLRLLHLAATHQETAEVQTAVHPDVAHALLNQSRNSLIELEQHSGCRIVISARNDFKREQVEFKCQDPRGSRVGFSPEQAIRNYRPLPSESPEQGTSEAVEDAQAERAEHQENGGEQPEVKPSKSKRRRRRRKKAASTTQQHADEQQPPTEQPEQHEQTEPTEPSSEDADQPDVVKHKRRRPRRRRKRTTTPDETAAPAEEIAPTPTPSETTDAEQPTPSDEKEKPKKRRRSRRRRSSKKTPDTQPDDAVSGESE